MVLEISRRNSGSAVRTFEPEQTVIPSALLATLCKGNPPPISSATMDGNKVSMNLDLPSYVDVSFRSVVHRGGSSPFTFTYTQNSPEAGKLDVELNGSGKYNFSFNPSARFHYTAGHLLNREMLANRGLHLDGDFKGTVEYETPFTVWRTLPESLLERVDGFQFIGPVFRVAYNMGDGSFRHPRNQLSCWVDNAYSDAMKSVEVKFKQRIAETGLAKYVSEIGRGTKGEHFEIIDPSKITMPESLIVLEEIAKEIPGGVVYRSPTGNSKLRMVGSFFDSYFSRVPEFFDSGSSDLRVGVQGKLGRLSVYKPMSSSSSSQWTLNDSNLEEAERFLQVSSSGAGRGWWLGQLGDNSVVLQDKGGSEAKYYPIVRKPQLPK